MILLHFIFPQATHAVVIGELCALSCIYFCGFVLLYKKRNLLHFLTWKDLRALFKLRLRILRNIQFFFVLQKNCTRSIEDSQVSCFKQTL